MNRQLKFRIWNPKTKKFHYWGFVDLQPGISGFAGVATDNDITLVKAENLSEQFTGLLDAKGNEIWEGDILSSADGIEFEVIWMNQHSCFGIIEKTERLFKMQGLVPEFTVIGNIHEGVKDD